MLSLLAERERERERQTLFLFQPTHADRYLHMLRCTNTSNKKVPAIQYKHCYSQHSSTICPWNVMGIYSYMGASGHYGKHLFCLAFSSTTLWSRGCSCKQACKLHAPIALSITYQQQNHRTLYQAHTQPEYSYIAGVAHVNMRVHGRGWSRIFLFSAVAFTINQLTEFDSS